MTKAEKEHGIRIVKHYKVANIRRNDFGEMILDIQLNGFTSSVVLTKEDLKEINKLAKDNSKRVQAAKKAWKTMRTVEWKRSNAAKKAWRTRRAQVVEKIQNKEM